MLTMYLLPFWYLNVSVPLLSMQCQKALGFHQKYLNLCSEDERRFYGFGTTWGWVINNIIFIFGWTITLTLKTLYGKTIKRHQKINLLLFSAQATKAQGPLVSYWDTNLYLILMFVSPKIRRPFGGINSLKTEHLFINACYNMVVIPEHFGIET